MVDKNKRIIMQKKFQTKTDDKNYVQFTNKNNICVESETTVKNEIKVSVVGVQTCGRHAKFGYIKKGLLFFVVMCMMVTATVAQTPWDGVTITPVTPNGNTYYIYTPEELAWIAQQCNSGNSFAGTDIILMNDIDLGGTAATPATWVPIGTETNQFRGNFDGGGNIIHNLFNNSPWADNIGLFGYIYNQGGDITISNVTINNIQITGKDYVGGIAGKIYSYSSPLNIINCNVSGSVKGNNSIGGLIGRSMGYGYNNTYPSNISIHNSSFSGIIEANTNGGGIVGLLYSDSASNFTMKNSYSNGNISGISDIGGIIGGFDCYYSNYFGTSIVVNCYSTMTMKAIGDYGGIVGYRPNSSDITFTSCFFDKQMAGTNNGVGNGAQTGTSGKLTSEMTTATGFGMANNTGTYPSQWVYINGLYPQLNIYASHINTDIQNASQLSVSPIFLQNSETSAGVSSNFTLSTTNGVSWASNVPAAININGANASVSPMIIDSMVTLTASLNGWEKKLRVNVGSDTILIFSANDLLLIANQCNNGSSYDGKYLKLMNDITLPVGVPNNMVSIGNYETNKTFKGTFDGNGKKIHNIYIDKPNTPYQGFFSYTQNAEIKNLGLVNVTASGRDYTGGMIGYAENTKIDNSFIYGGTLFALNYCGGLVGYQTSGTKSIITACSNSGCKVTGNNYVGGLLGFSDHGTVRNSYVVAEITGLGGNGVGAIIGKAIDVLFYPAPYWNIDSTNNLPYIGDNVINSKTGENGAKTDGMTSAEMRTQSFVNTLNQGLVNPMWKMDFNPPINNGFPIHVWRTGDNQIGINNYDCEKISQTNSEITVFPNPTNGQITVQTLPATSPQNDASFQIYDISGRIVQTQFIASQRNANENEFTIDISNLTNGMYYLKIGNETVKIIKN